MKKFLIIALSLVMGFMAVTMVGGVPAMAETDETSKKGISFLANGTGKVSIDPDIAYFTVGVTVERDKAADAMADNNELMAAVLEAIKATGLAEDDIKTSTINLEVVYDYSGSTRVLKGYAARNSLALTIRDLEKIAEVIDATVEAGATDISSLYFDKEDRDEAYDQALALAVERATAKVKVLAKAAGVDAELSPRTISEGGVQIYYPAAREMSMDGASAGVPIVPGQIEITANVSVEFSTVD